MRHAIFHDALRRLGYKKHGEGYRMPSEHYFHFIDIHEEMDKKVTIQLWAFSNSPSIDDIDRVYDTGMVTIPRTQVFDLIQMFKENFK